MQKIFLILLIVLLATPFTLKGQSADGNYRQHRKWYVPDAAVIQYAGNMGMISAGPGYDLAHEKIAIDLLFGYVPKFEATEIGRLITLKTSYKPFKIDLNNKYAVTPLQVGMGISYHFGDQYSTSWEGAIPKGYYWWPTSWRVLGFAGASVTRTVNSNVIKDIKLYSEFGTYDLVVTAWYKDDKLRVWDILSASVGIRARF